MFVALCGCLFALASLPALAGPGLAGDSADQLPAADSVTGNLVAGTVRVPDRDVLFASDVSQQIVAAAEQAVAEPKKEGRAQTLLKGALALLGTPYRWGGTSPEGGFDCSGLVGYVFRTIGIDLPRVSRSMANEGTAVVDRTALAEGDLVFFGKRGRVDHVGIYIGEGKFLHAPRTGRDVTVSSMDSGYWSQKYLQARRLATGA